MTPAMSIHRICAAVLEIKAQLCHKGAHGTLEVSAFLLPVFTSWFCGNKPLPIIGTLHLRTAPNPPNDEG